MEKYLLALILTTSFNPFFAQVSVDCASNGTNFDNWTLFESSNNPEIDRATNEELGFLTKSFLVSPAFYYFDDSSGMNAFSTSENLNNSQSKFGTICFGINLIYEQISLSQGGTNVPIILAHEFAHTVARVYSLNLPTKQNELFADYLAGGYMYYRNRNFKRTDLQAAFQSFYNMGDNDFTNPSHHGTPLSRSICIQQGYEDCERAYQQGHSFTLDEGVRLAVEYVTTHDLP
ncbi:MAG TPA: hypothetical protein VFM99_10890 [Chitinophagales bacterium]|nr:hypothetical protein [Chitinophagales bacterium]